MSRGGGGGGKREGRGREEKKERELAANAQSYAEMMRGENPLHPSSTNQLKPDSLFVTR